MRCLIALCVVVLFVFALAGTAAAGGRDSRYDRGGAVISIPGFFPPILLDGRVLGDGGLLCRVPLDLLSRRRCGFLG